MSASPDIGIDREHPDFTGYLAIPERPRGPGLLIFHAIFGVNEVVRNVADGFAREGYLTLAPDLFWRQQPGVRLSEQRQEDWARGRELFAGFDMDLGMRDLQTALRRLREHPSCTGAVGAVGYCFGGRMAYMMAAHTDVDVAVSYYGTAIERHLDDAPKVHRPLMLHLAERDHYVPPEAQAAIKSALAGNPLVVIHDYPGMDHAFARLGAPAYDESAATLANQRTARFLAGHLR